ncbi:hypothetical protein [Streptomyces mangrovisoli]|uniref:Uncharacterized protein n=1 Tax=Streptomyces mangrovisoli TaxID=1428628 RepID=A0A1J4NVC8_9ACTN|nr:hypothetical protein [Streptomyces mangrovisoli]OIJ66034.1 hypothetical protein WN71_020415 [Streptomyces mangrovisoli]
MKIQVVACDIDQQVPAKTYTITVSDGRSISKDLCEEHGACLEDLLGELEVGAQESVAELKAEPVVPVRRSPAARKAPAKSATPARRRARVVSFEEIEARKIK